MRNSRVSAVIAIGLGLALAGCAGCASTGSRSTAAAPPTAAGFQSARIAYAIDAGTLGVPLAVSRVGARQVSYEEMPSEPRPGRSVGTLEIAYPHPAGRPGLALVGVVIQQRREEKRGVLPDVGQMWRDVMGRDDFFLRGAEQEVHEAWVLDVPREELVRIVAGLERGRFFEGGEIPAAAAPSTVQMAAAIDGRQQSRAWQAVPELDELMQRVRTEGQLISYRTAALPAQSGWQRPASLVAYERNMSMSAPTETLFAAPGLPRNPAGQQLDPFFHGSAAAVAELPGPNLVR